MLRRQVFLQCLCLAAILAVCGCGQSAKKPAPDTNLDTGVQQTSDADKRTMASRFSTLATEVGGVQKATVVVASRAETTGVSVDPMTGFPNDGSITPPGPPGDMANPEQGSLVAMVGITVDQSAMQNPDQVKKVKQQISDKIKADNDKVKEVLVTTDPNLVKKLQDVAAGIIKGQPVQSYAPDINELNKNIRSQ